MLIPTEAIATRLPGNPRIRPPKLRNPPSTVPTGLPLAIPEWMTTRLPRKGGYPRTRGGLSLLPQSFQRHQHLPLGCQPRSPECSTCFSQSLYDLARLRRPPNQTPLCLNGSFTPRPTSHSDMLNCAAPAHPRTILLHGRTIHNNVTELVSESICRALPTQRIHTLT